MCTRGGRDSASHKFGAKEVEDSEPCIPQEGGLAREMPRTLSWWRWKGPKGHPRGPLWLCSPLTPEEVPWDAGFFAQVSERTFWREPVPGAGKPPESGGMQYLRPALPLEDT